MKKLPDSLILTIRVSSVLDRIRGLRLNRSYFLVISELYCKAQQLRLLDSQRRIADLINLLYWESHFAFGATGKINNRM